jgi:hypothetical protein
MPDSQAQGAKTDLKAVKAVSIALLGFVLFMSLTAFGIAFTLNSTILNRDFLPNELDRLDIGSLVTEGVEMGTTDLPPDIRDAVVRAVTKLEPQVRAQFRAADYKVYAYLLGQTATLDLRQILKDTLLNKGFVASVENEADVLTLARQSLRNELADLIPPSEAQFVVYLDQAMPGLDLWLKKQIDAATGPVIDYLVGDASSLHLVISLDPMKTTLRDSARAAFLKSPPSQLAGASQSQLDAVFGQYYSLFAAQIPSTTTIDPASLGLGTSASMSQSLADAEKGLARARTEIGRFRLYYVLLIVGILVVVAAIILIHHEIKGSARDLGIIFLTYGFLEFIGALIAGYSLAHAHISGLPDAVQAWLPGVYSDIFRRLEVLSAVLAIVGLSLVIVSLLYKRRSST